MSTESILDSFRYYSGEHNHARFNEINQAYRSILKRTKWWNMRSMEEDLISLKANTYKYKVDLSCFRGGSPTHIYIKSPSKDIWNLIEESKFDIFEDSRPSSDGISTSDSNTYPTCYKLTGGSDYNFYVTPTPSQDTDIRFDGVKAIEDLDVDVEPIISEDYHEAIAIMAASIFLKQKSEATQQDLVKSSSLRQEAEIEIKSLIDDMHPNRLKNLSWDAGPLLY
jgi:hypothetical protein